MSIPNLPPELLDHIVDFLSDSRTALRICCLVSKSWIPRTRRHLFANIRFDTVEMLRLWRKTFPDPSTTPARYAKALIVGCIEAVIAADAEAGGWIRGFSSAERLELIAYPNGSEISPLAFHGFSPIVKSLCLNLYTISPSQIFDLTLSFPLLQDLTVIVNDVKPIDGNDPSQLSTVVQSPNQPMTGILDLSQCRWMGSVANRLLSLPGGIHFWKLALKWSRPEDISLAKALVEECSHTLEHIKIACGFLGTPSRYPLPPGNSFLILAGCGPDLIDLSKAIRLVLLAARCQPAKMARAWCIAGLAIGKCGRGGRQKVAGRTKRPFGYIGKAGRSTLD